MEASPRWTLPLLYAGQAQKEIFHNEALVRIDALLHGCAQSADMTEVPELPEPGQCWIVAAGATGAWAGMDDAVACWSEGGWRFIAPRAGLRLLVADRSHPMIHDGAQWRDGAVREDGLYLDGQRVVGSRQEAISVPVGGTVIDAEARTAIMEILSALREHGLIAI